MKCEGEKWRKEEGEEYLIKGKRDWVKVEIIDNGWNEKKRNGDGREMKENECEGKKREVGKEDEKKMNWKEKGKEDEKKVELIERSKL